MTWTDDEQRAVGHALLGSWPGTITGWGREAFAAYIDALQRRGLTAEQMIRAVDTWPAGSDFPPSAPNLAAAALDDPSAPTFEEMVALVWGRGGVLRARPPYTGKPITDADHDAAAVTRAAGMHPLISQFVHRQGLRRLRMVEVDCPDFGEVRRKELRQAWDAMCEALEGREVAALASGRGRGELAAFDPLAALGVPATHQLAGAKTEAGK